MKLPLNPLESLTPFDLNRLLSTRRYEHAQLWSLDTAHATRAVLRLSAEPSQELLFAALDCVELRGPTSWSRPELKAHQLGSNDFAVADERVGFSLRCKGFSGEGAPQPRIGRQPSRPSTRLVEEPPDVVLRRWVGADAHIWKFRVGHKRVALRLSRPGDDEVLFVGSAGCRRIDAPMTWTAANIGIERLTSQWRIFDTAGPASIECSLPVLLYGSRADVDDSFESFLGDIANE